MKIFFATGNQGKVEHLQKLLDCEVEQLDAETVEPSDGSLQEIARYKVVTAAENSDVEGKIIADDSGLFVEKLNGFPGIHTSFFDEKVGKDKLLDLVEEGAEAEFRTAFALKNGPEIKIFTGSEKGEIVSPRGSEGFGYDPTFLPEGSDETWGEDSSQKQESSHRKEAVEKLVDYLGKQ